MTNSRSQDLIGKVKKQERVFKSNGIFLFEPMQKYENKRKICVVHAMTEEKDTYIVEVMKVSTEDVTMYKNATIGYLLPIKQQVDSPSLKQ